MKSIEIGDIGNYEGGILIAEENGKCFWTLEGYDASPFTEIPRKL
jgi:hypothetical protein